MQMKVSCQLLIVAVNNFSKPCETKTVDKRANCFLLFRAFTKFSRCRQLFAFGLSSTRNGLEILPTSSRFCYHSSRAFAHWNRFVGVRDFARVAVWSPAFVAALQVFAVFVLLLVGSIFFLVGLSASKAARSCVEAAEETEKTKADLQSSPAES